MQRTAVDTTKIPTALLPRIKEHLRVRHTRDDALIADYIAAAVGLLERGCNVSLDPATYIGTTSHGVAWCAHYPTTPAQHAYSLPLNNVRTAKINDGATPPNDYTGDYEVWNADFGGNGSSFLVGTGGRLLAPGWVIELDVGLDDPAKLAPAFFALIARMTGSLYENREAASALWADTWKAELIALWRPSA